MQGEQRWSVVMEQDSWWLEREDLWFSELAVE